MSTEVDRRLIILLIVVIAGGGAFLLLKHKGGSSGSSKPTSSAPVPSTNATPTPSAGTTPKSTSGSATKGGSATKAKSGKTSPAPSGLSAGPGLPRRVAAAMRAHKEVVLLFWNPRGTDDRSVKRAVDRLPRRKGKVAVFSDRVSHVSRYLRITSVENVNQTPTLVFIDPRGKAETASGYLDYQTIYQYVVDDLAGR